MKHFYITISLLLFSTVAFAQYHTGLVPRASPDKGVYQKIGYTKVEIRYGSPAVKDRPIWGQLVPYNEVWRAGANNATTIHFSDSVSINDQVLAAGTYALFIIPQEQAPWTFIFSRRFNQWGSFGYDIIDDALRIDVLPQQAEFTEYLNYTIDQSDFNHGQINMNWGNVQLSFGFETHYLQQFIQVVEEKAMNKEMESGWISWLQGAEYLEQIGTELEQAQTWITKAEAAATNDYPDWNSQFYPLSYIRGHALWIKAKLAARRGEFTAALQAVEQLKSIETTYSYYERKKKGESIDQKAAEWKRELEKE